VFYKKSVEPKTISAFWNRKSNFIFNNSFDISDILNFYRIYSIENVAALFADKNISLYVDAKNRVKNTIASYRDIVPDIHNYSLLDIVPEQLLSEYLTLETEVLKNTYSFLRKDNENIEFITNFFNKFHYFDCLKKLKYNVNTTEGFKKVDLTFQANFRLKSSPGYFNLFNMQKSDRSKVVPYDKDSIIYCADFRQFEIRTFCMIHPELDVDFSNREIYKDLADKLGMNHEDAKVQIIAYGYGQQNNKLDKVLNRGAILSNASSNFFSWEQYPVILKELDPESVRIHTIVQTISQYIYFEKLYKILALLDGKKSKFIFPLHDSVILSLHKDEIYLRKQIKDILEDEVYKVKEYIGNDFLNLKEI
jgi:hypothetical protein